MAEHNKLFAVDAEQEGSASVANTMGAWREILCPGRPHGWQRQQVKWQRLSLRLPPSRLRPHFVRAAGATLICLPPYSPDLNPIEQVFSKLKTLLRRGNARTVEDTWRRIGHSLDRFTTHECANYFRNAG
jgi:transposase